MDKQATIDFLEEKNTYDIILSVMENYITKNGDDIEDYPIDGLICGGAVANTILYLLNKDKFETPIINDIDIFCFNHNTRGYNYMPNNDASFFIQKDINKTINISDYGKTWYGPQGEEIIMVNTSRGNIINKIDMDVFLWSKDYNPCDYYMDLLKTFDLNCCTVGLDRVNRKVIYDDTFVEFLVTNRIKVLSLTHPLQTAVRMKKKVGELKTDDSNFDIEMSLIQHSFLYSRSRYLGQEWVEKSKQHSEFVNKYFKEYKSQYTNQDDLYEYTATDFELVDNVKSFGLSGGYNSLILFWDLFVRNGLTTKGVLLLKYYRERLGMVSDNKKYIWTSGHSYNFMRGDFTYDNHLTFMDIVNVSPKYFDCDFTYEELVRVGNFFRFLGKGYVESTPFIVTNIIEQQMFIDYFKDNFIDKYNDVKSNLLYKMFDNIYFNRKIRVGCSSLSVKTKIKHFNKAIRGIFINNIIANRFTFNKQKIRTINLNNDEF